MSLFLIILAAGNSKRLKSNIPKPFHVTNNRTLLEHSFNAFRNFPEIKKTIIVYNKKHTKYVKTLKLGNLIAIDTEAMGLNHQRDRLCLIQLSNGNGTCHLVKINDVTNKPKNLIKILEKGLKHIF